MEHSRELQRLARIGVNISREFTSPLSILVSTLEEFERNEKDPAKRLQLKVAMRNAYKFRSLTRDVFTLAKLMSADVLYRMVKTDLISFINNVVKSFGQAASEKHIELQFKSSIDKLECYIDFQKVYRIVYRLLANGIRFMKAEGGVVRVSVFYLKDHNKLQIEVWDNGIGIIPEKVPHVFDLFYEKDPIHLMYYQGTGIGLYLVKHLTEALDGKITVESEKFSFTRFVVNLPFYAKKEEVPFDHVEIIEDVSYDQLAIMEEVTEVDTDEILQIRLPQEKSTLVVVIAEEEYAPFWRQAFGKKVELLFVTSIDTALGKILDLVPDLIIAQKQVSHVSGAEAITFLRNNEVVSHIPMVLFCPTGTLTKQEVLEASADEFINGIESPENTFKIINNLVENRKKVYRAAYQDAINEFKQSKALSMEESFLAKINGLLDKHMADEEFNVEQLSEEMYMSRTQIHRKLRAITNMSTTQYVKQYKLKKAYKDLQAHTGTVSEIAYRYGFSSPAYFSRVFHEIYGMKPSEIPRNEE